MKRLLFAALIALCANTLPALDYTVSVAIPSDLLNASVQLYMDVQVFADLCINDMRVARSPSIRLNPTRDTPSATFVFSDIQDAFVDITRPNNNDSRVEVVYYYTLQGGVSKTEFARQRVPAVAYAVIADTVENAIGDFTVSGTLTAKRINAHKQTELTLTGTSNQTDTLSAKTLTSKALAVNQNITATTTTLSGEATFKGKLVGLGTIPIGSIILFTSATTPGDNWQLCDGSPITEGPFAGQKTPNLNGRFPRATTDYATVGTTGGASSVTLKLENIPAHTHQYTLTEPYSITANMKGASQSSSGGSDWISGGDKTFTSSSAGSSSPSSFPLLPPFVATQFYIRIK
ncbi:MAG: hypothetical protein IJV69_00735 [Kiritimatiellae bacterium]|nr:hypothetical protein [Kiritimatiellia bacterium]